MEDFQRPQNVDILKNFLRDIYRLKNLYFYRHFKGLRDI